ncbi:MAG: hypothetical protein K2I89_00025 [Muribaculaceae bacterium]|nr:hypothetical protein [Muribaculaceae bacterium]MDE5593946.1 hypothetical protein [Muribaculaceae bacterium]
MAVDLKQQLERVAAKADLIVERCKRLTKQRDELLERIAELERKLETSEKEAARLRVDNEYLSLASSLFPDRKGIENARSLISGLVRDIDRCILDLKE